MVEAVGMVVVARDRAALGAQIAAGDGVLAVPAHARDAVILDRDDRAARGIAQPAERAVLGDHVRAS
jgi:hypothetical protein